MGELQVTAEPGIPQVLTSWTFDAPRELVFRAFVDPELVRHWLGPRDYTITIDRFEAHDGGRWRYVHSKDEERWGFHGVFHGDPSVDGIVQTFEFEGWPGKVQLDTVTFEEHDGRTTVRTNSVFQSVEARDALVESGMADGLREGFERLEELLARDLKSRHD
jgi:uncharacterized protein YndB with AHSA1/START domain